MFKDEQVFFQRPHRALRTISLLVLLIAAHSGGSCSLAGPPKVIAEFNIDRNSGFLTLPVTVGARTYPFALDTGTSTLVFDVSLRELLGEPTRQISLLTAAGTQDLQCYVAPPMRIGTLPARRGDAFCLDFREQFLIFGESVFGMIGQAFLRDKIFRVDFDKGKVEFLDRLGEPRGERLPLTWKLGAPFVVADIPGFGKEEFLIDTGSTGFDSGALRKPLFNRLLSASDLQMLATRGVQSFSPTGAVHASQARLRRFKLGPFQHDGLIFTNSDVSSLTLWYLSRFLVTFDLAHSAIYLAPGQGYQQRDRYLLADFTIIRFNGKTKIWVLEPVLNQGAALSGLKAMDEVISVDGRPAANASLLELRRLLCTPGQRNLRIQQVDGVRDFSIILEEPPEVPPSVLHLKTR